MRPSMGRLANFLLVALTTYGIAADTQSAPPKTSVDDAPRLIKLLAPKFDPLPKPEPGDWLAKYPEKGQTYRAYRARRKRPICDEFSTIEVQPLGDFTKSQKKLVDETAKFMEAFFGTPVTVLETLPLDDMPPKATRLRSDGKRQLLTTYLLQDVLKPRRSKDSAALLGFVADDLWPGEGWNFVFGQASLQERIGVWSLFRNGDLDGDADEARLCRVRTLKTAVHETGHMFGIPHCVAYACCMNGSNHLEESDRTPLEFCPECQAKLWWTCRIDPQERYQRLLQFCEDAGLAKEAKFWRELNQTLDGN